MIAELASDLLAKVKSVPEVSERSSLTLGGKKLDPDMLGVAVPAAWVQFMGDVVDEKDFTHGPATGYVSPSQTMMATFSVLVLLAYTDDLTTLSNYELIERIHEAAHGTEARYMMNWRYIGQTKSRVFNDRIGFELRFTITYVTNA